MLTPQQKSIASKMTGYLSGAQQRASGGRVEPKNINHNPTPAQAEAGNYAKDKIHIHGLPITIENAKGSKRTGMGKDGKKWSVRMAHNYGYIRGTEARDGDHVDCHVGPHIRAPLVFIIDQVNAETGKYDEPKCMIGFANLKHAKNAYENSFSDGKGKDRIGKITETTISQFKSWLADGDTKKPFKLVIG